MHARGAPAKPHIEHPFSRVGRTRDPLRAFRQGAAAPDLRDLRRTILTPSSRLLRAVPPAYSRNLVGTIVELRLCQRRVRTCGRLARTPDGRSIGPGEYGYWTNDRRSYR